MKIKNLVIISLILLVYSCEKENPAKAPEIKAGDYKNMIINYFDTTLAGGYHCPKTLNIDLDNDGVDDFQLESEIWGSPGMGHIPVSAIKCLHNSAKLLGDFTYDTLFVNRDTLIQEGAYSGTWEKYLINNYTCNRIEQNDSILLITPVFELTILERDQPIRKSETYVSDTLTLISGPRGNWPVFVGVSGDTTIYEYNVSYNDCRVFPLEQIVFLGVELNNDRLGWIKLTIFDYYKVMLLESGIQK